MAMAAAATETMGASSNGKTTGLHPVNASSTLAVSTMPMSDGSDHRLVCGARGFDSRRGLHAPKVFLAARSPSKREDSARIRVGAPMASFRELDRASARAVHRLKGSDTRTGQCFSTTDVPAACLLAMEDERVRFSRGARRRAALAVRRALQTRDGSARSRRSSPSSHRWTALGLLSPCGEDRYLVGAHRPIRLVAQDARPSLSRRGFDSRIGRHAPAGGSGGRSTKPACGGSIPSRGAICPRPRIGR